ncbi:MAG: lysophospholipid acyltransferase family protein [Leptospirales bacterium]
MRFAIFLTHLLLNLLGKSLRISVTQGSDLIDKVINEGKPVILATWHNRLLFFSYFLSTRYVQKGLKTIVLVSPSKDGDLAATVAEKFYAETIRGSSSRSGASAFLKLVRKMRKQGYSIVIMPDGPRGPCYDFKPGAIQLSSMNQAPIYLLNSTMEKKWSLNSWDRMSIPKPFSKVQVKVEGPIQIPKDLTDEKIQKWQKDLSKRLLNLSDDNPTPKNKSKTIVDG